MRDGSRRAAGTMAVALGLTVAPAVARAQSNYASTPLGGRSALMGNTGVALAKDGAAPFLNPATIGRIEDAKFAFSVNMYSASLVRYRNWHAPAAVDANRYGSGEIDGASETQSRLDVVPSTLCFFLTLRGFGEVFLGERARTTEQEEAARGREGREKLAVCAGTTEREIADYPALNFKSSTGVRQAQSFTRSWSRFQVGPTFSSYITDRLALGISVHGSYSSYESYWTSTNVGTDRESRAVASSFSSSANAHAFDLAVIAGATYRLNRGSHIGVSFQSQAGSPWGTYRANESSVYSRPDRAEVTLATGNFAAPMPFRLSVGFGEEWPRLRVETNMSLYAPAKRALSSDIHVDETTLVQGAIRSQTRDFTAIQRANVVVNSAMGFEYAATPDLSVLGGVGTDFSASDRLRPQGLPAVGLFTEERVNRAIVSGGVGSHGKTAELLVGAQLGYGWGRAYAVNSLVVPNALAVVDVYQYSGILIIAGSADLRTIGRVVKRVVTPE